MRLTRRDITVILYLVGILALALTYQFYVAPTLKETETTLTECESLQKQVDQLMNKTAMQPEYESQIAQMEDEIGNVLSEYPSSISEEDIILYAKELNDELDMNVTNVSFSTASPIYSIVGTGYASDYNFVCESISINVDYSTDYEGLKNIVNYVNSDADHRVITSVSIGISAAEEDSDSETEEDTVINSDESSDTISGTMTISLYLIDGKPVELDEDGNPVLDEERYTIPEVDHGVDDIFRTDGSSGGTILDAD